MSIAELTSKLSYAKRLQVGSVIVRDHKILATGYNGMPTGWDNICEVELLDGVLQTKPETFHSESNAISKVARSTESSEGATMFCTHAPCMECAKLIYQSGISTVWFKEYYRDEKGLNFLKLSNVNVQFYDPPV